MRECRRVGLPTPSWRWTAREIKLLGTLPDREWSRRLRRPEHDIGQQRRTLQIEPFKPRAPYRWWTLAEIRLLGAVPDADLAVRLNRSEAAVVARRHQRRISMFQPGQ